MSGAVDDLEVIALFGAGWARTGATEATKAACDHIDGASLECVSGLFALMLRRLKDQDLRICATRYGIVEVCRQPCPSPRTSALINLDTDLSPGIVPMPTLPYRTCIHPPSRGHRTRVVERFIAHTYHSRWRHLRGTGTAGNWNRNGIWEETRL